jgi:hypothetical protein
MPRTAATVGTDTVTGRDVQRLAGELRRSERAAANSPIGPDGGQRSLPDRRLEQLVLSQLIKARVVTQLAAEEGVSAPAGDLARTASAELPETEFSDAGWGRPDFETAMRSSILSKALAEKLFPTVEVAESAVRDYFTAHPDLFQPTWKATVDLAFFATQDAARRLSTEPHASSSFPDAARAGGATDVLAAQAVDQKSPLPPEILGAIGTMTARTVSAPIAVPKGWWVVNATELNRVGAQTLETARPSIRAHLADQERQSRFAAWLTDKVRTAPVRVNAHFGRWPDDFVL